MENYKHQGMPRVFVQPISAKDIVCEKQGIYEAKKDERKVMAVAKSFKGGIQLKPDQFFKFGKVEYKLI